MKYLLAGLFVLLLVPSVLAQKKHQAGSRIPGISQSHAIW